jgi:hypothetical protein
LLLFDLLDGPDSVIGVNDFLADFKAHHSTSIDSKIRLRRTGNLGETF